MVDVGAPVLQQDVAAYFPSYLGGAIANGEYVVVGRRTFTGPLGDTETADAGTQTVDIDDGAWGIAAGPLSLQNYTLALCESVLVAYSTCGVSGGGQNGPNLSLLSFAGDGGSTFALFDGHNESTLMQVAAGTGEVDTSATTSAGLCPLICTGLADYSGPIGASLVVGPAPTAAGGPPPVDGTYAALTMTDYSGTSGLTDAGGDANRLTIRISGGNIEIVAGDPSQQPTRVSGPVAFSGSNGEVMTVTPSCIVQGNNSNNTGNNGGNNDVAAFTFGYTDHTDGGFEITLAASPDGGSNGGPNGGPFTQQFIFGQVTAQPGPTPAVCSAITDVGSDYSSTDVASYPPAAAGGTIANGLYVAVSQTTYTGPNGDTNSSAAGTDTLLIDNGTVQTTAHNSGGGASETLEIALCESLLISVGICGTAEDNGLNGSNYVAGEGTLTIVNGGTATTYALVDAGVGFVDTSTTTSPGLCPLACTGLADLSGPVGATIMAQAAPAPVGGSAPADGTYFAVSQTDYSGVGGVTDAGDDGTRLTVRFANSGFELVAGGLSGSSGRFSGPYTLTGTNGSTLELYPVCSAGGSSSTSPFELGYTDHQDGGFELEFLPNPDGGSGGGGSHLGQVITLIGAP